MHKENFTEEHSGEITKSIEKDQRTDDGTGINYPDAEPDTLGELIAIKRISGMKHVAPNISWGEEYLSWPLEKRLHRAERVASTMNHAADILQQERDKLIEIMKNQEIQLKANAVSYSDQGELMHKELGAQDAEKQQLYIEIVGLAQTIKEQKKYIKSLKNQVADFELVKV